MIGTVLGERARSEPWVNEAAFLVLRHAADRTTETRCKFGDDAIIVVMLIQEGGPNGMVYIAEIRPAEGRPVDATGRTTIFVKEGAATCV